MKEAVGLMYQGSVTKKRERKREKKCKKHTNKQKERKRGGERDTPGGGKTFKNERSEAWFDSHNDQGQEDKPSQS